MEGENLKKVVTSQNQGNDAQNCKVNLLQCSPRIMPHSISVHSRNRNERITKYMNGDMAIQSEHSGIVILVLFSSIWNIKINRPASALPAKLLRRPSSPIPPK